jgi:hypothetical protein
MSELHRARVPPHHISLASAVPPVLTEEIAERLPRSPFDRYRRVEEQPISRPSDPVIHFVVLVRLHLLVPSAQGAKERYRVGAERDVVDLATRVRIVVGGVSYTEG